jgi:uncharacterized protein YjbI with pentapeptide repeats
MVNDKHLLILRQGATQWNNWISGPNAEWVDLSHAILGCENLSGVNLADVYLRDANFTLANLSNAILMRADLRGATLNRATLNNAKLHGADMTHANLTQANLIDVELDKANLNDAAIIGANLSNASLHATNFTRANLTNANLCNASLEAAIFTGANLTGANLAGAQAAHTIFADIDLRSVKGLDSIEHFGPSQVSISTLYLSEGHIPEKFLQGCGIPDEFITQIPSLVAGTQPIQFHSCFISYTSKDEDFARRLHERMRAAGLRVWFAPEDIKGGDKLFEQIDHAIQVHDRLLLVLSEESMKSKWVLEELRRARKAEERENRRKLFPIRLVHYDALKEWECFDTDLRQDLAAEVRKYFIPDFSQWKRHDYFEAAFKRLLDDLKASV